MRPLSAEDLWRLRRVGPAAPMPEGATAVVPVTACPPDEDEPRTRLWRIHASGAPRVPLTTDEPRRATRPAPSPDGSRIPYVWKAPGKDEPPQLHVMAANGTDAHRVTDLPGGTRDLRWLPDGRPLGCVADPYANVSDPEATRARRAERAGRATAHVTEDRIHRFWDRWLTHAERPRLGCAFCGGPDDGGGRGRRGPGRRVPDRVRVRVALHPRLRVQRRLPLRLPLTEPTGCAIHCLPPPTTSYVPWSRSRVNAP